MNTIQLLTESILQVPILSYPKDFTFIVNNEEFQTTKLVACLLSSKISKIHQIDPTLCHYTINTKYRGDFQHFLDILNFQTTNISETELSFFSEIIDQLETEKVNLNINTPEINSDNIFNLIFKHQQQKIFYSKNLSQEIEFLSSHFSEMIEKQREEFLKLDLYILEKVINNQKLELESEDQLLQFINELCSKNSEYSNLYEYVYFKNVSNEAMLNFLDVFDIEYLTRSIWSSLFTKFSDRNDESRNRQYHQKEVTIGKEIQYLNGQLNGIFNYLRENSNDILNEINVSCENGYNSRDAKKLLDINCTDNDFYPNGDGKWICFEFKNRKIIPSNYSIRSYNGDQHLRSWVIECSEDGEKWTKVDEQNDSTSLKGRNIVHTFPIQKPGENEEKPYKYIRIRMTKNNWNNSKYIDICSVEFYGNLI